MGLALLDAQSDPAAPARHAVPLEWGTGTTVLGLVDPNPGGIRSWSVDRTFGPLIDLRAPRAHDVWVRTPGALCVPAGPYGRMVGGTPLPLVARLVGNSLGLGLVDRELPVQEEARTTRAPAEAAPPLPGRSPRNVDGGERPGTSGSSGGYGPLRQ